MSVDGIEFRTANAALSIDPDARLVTLSDGDSLPYDSIMIATGASARRLPVAGNHLPGVHVLRTLSNAQALREALQSDPRVAVLGGGFIGGEFASVARDRGLDVATVERAAPPFAQGLSKRVGHLLARPHLERGVSLHTSAQVTAVLGTDRAEALEFADGSRLGCDLMLVGIGVTPNTEWLEGSGISVDDGVLCASWSRPGRRSERALAVENLRGSISSLQVDETFLSWVLTVRYVGSRNCLVRTSSLKPVGTRCESSRAECVVLISQAVSWKSPPTICQDEIQQSPSWPLHQTRRRKCKTGCPQLHLLDRCNSCVDQSL